jgi:hypothetical protein
LGREIWVKFENPLKQSLPRDLIDLGRVMSVNEEHPS